MEQFSKKVEELREVIQKFISNVKLYVSTHKNVVMIGGITLGVLVLITVVIFFLRENQKVLDSQEASGVEIVSVEDEVEEVITRTLEDVPSLVLEENAYEEVNAFVNQYYDAQLRGDVEAYRAMIDETDETEEIKMQKLSAYLEMYQNISCYTKLGPFEDTYLVYVYYEVKFKDIETSAPGLNPLYIYKNEDGNFQIAMKEMDDEIKAYLKEASAQDDFIELFNTVQVRYNEAIAKDQALNDFLIELPTRLKTEIGEQLAEQEVQNENSVSENETASENATASENEVEATEDAPETITVTTYKVKANETVNVRQSDSTSADKVGKATVGDTFTCTEQLANGWSKIIFEGSEAFIKTEFLDILETIEETVDPNEETDESSSSNLGSADEGNVLVLTTVNIRATASESGKKLGVAYPGDQFKLLMKQADGWTKIKYDGETAFVKSEFVE